MKSCLYNWTGFLRKKIQIRPIMFFDNNDHNNGVNRCILLSTLHHSYPPDQRYYPLIHGILVPKLCLCSFDLHVCVFARGLILVLILAPAKGDDEDKCSKVNISQSNFSVYFNFLLVNVDNLLKLLNWNWSGNCGTWLLFHTQLSPFSISKWMEYRLKCLFLVPWQDVNAVPFLRRILK